MLLTNFPHWTIFYALKKMEEIKQNTTNNLAVAFKVMLEILIEDTIHMKYTILFELYKKASNSSFKLIINPKSKSGER
jgi:hypothetical protein